MSVSKCVSVCKYNATWPLLAAQQEPYKKACFLFRNMETFVKKNRGRWGGRKKGGGGEVEGMVH